MNGNNPFEIFNYKNLGSVRTKLDEHGNPWFCLSDVCSILGIANNRNVVSRLLEKGVRSMDTLTPGGMQSLVFVDEPNLYKVIMGSRKAEAQEFQNWICYEVIPMIRRTGAYMTPETFLQLQQDPSFVRTLAENYITAYDQVQYLQNKVDELQPAADKFYEWLNDTEPRTIRAASHTIAIKGMGLINLFRYFRKHGFVDNKNIAYKKYEDQGLFYVRHYKEPWNSTNKPYRAQTMITNKGIDYFRYRLLSEGYQSLDFDGEAEPVISEPLTMQEAIARFSPNNRLN
jgi:Prophage antirepressor